jgi:hypothetical protein
VRVVIRVVESNRCAWHGTLTVAGGCGLCLTWQEPMPPEADRGCPTHPQAYAWLYGPERERRCAICGYWLDRAPSHPDNAAYRPITHCTDAQIEHLLATVGGELRRAVWRERLYRNLRQVRERRNGRL